MDVLKQIFVNWLYLLALINPISKIAILSGLSSTNDSPPLSAVVRQSSFTALCILLGSMFFGDFILRQVFHVDLNALKASGGAVLFWSGFMALRRGTFFEQDSSARSVDLAIVPLACPLIAGPATIAASIALAAREGLLWTTVSMFLALMANSALMLYAKPIAEILKKIGILGALIRITGLIVMTIGVQMIMDGLADWLNKTPV